LPELEPCAELLVPPCELLDEDDEPVCAEAKPIVVTSATVATDAAMDFNEVMIDSPRMNDASQSL
jgi:hypothetical protein